MRRLGGRLSAGVVPLRSGCSARMFGSTIEQQQPQPQVISVVKQQKHFKKKIPN
jgi:hypothetical protein